MKHSIETDINLTHSRDLLEHMPKAFKSLAEIEQKAQVRFCEIMSSIECGGNTLKEVKRQITIPYILQETSGSSLTHRIRGVRDDN